MRQVSRSHPAWLGRRPFACSLYLTSSSKGASVSGIFARMCSTWAASMQLRVCGLASLIVNSSRQNTAVSSGYILRARSLHKQKPHVSKQSCVPRATITRRRRRNSSKHNESSSGIKIKSNNHNKGCNKNNNNDRSGRRGPASISRTSRSRSLAPVRTRPSCQNDTASTQRGQLMSCGILTCSVLQAEGRSLSRSFRCVRIPNLLAFIASH